MAPDNSTASEYHALEVNTPALSIIQDSTINAGDTMVEIALLSLLFGVLTVLSFTSTYFLVRRGSFTQTSVRVLVLSTVLIYMSTGTYVAALIWNRVQANQLVSRAMDGLFSASYDGPHEMAIFEDAMRKQFSMAVFGLEVNWIIGDAIVWWRACVIWRKRVIYYIGLLLVTCTLGVVRTTGLALLEVYNPYLAVFAILSLATNVSATSLIAYKAWEHRRFVKKYFSEAGAKSQVLKTLALLVESGSVYCALMVFIIIYYTRDKLAPSQSPAGDAGLVFTKVGGTYFVYGCIGPLVAIYPTIIVFLIALKQSPIDNGVLSQVYQARRDSGIRGDPGLVEEGVKSTIVFQGSTLQSSAGADMENAREEGTPASDHPSGTRSRGSSESFADSEQTAASTGTGGTLV